MRRDRAAISPVRKSVATTTPVGRPSLALMTAAACRKSPVAPSV